ncbi:hypothetical protein BRPE64_BCDS03510 [Caballeronia insecticola]|uniref:Uncharacterized protein n=1 Tax=Caballeronia insecticola TaxID=758793 RepID=R4X1H6_9BURK|nr:hypothetical protein BRPE64_BCDS03510 [Caballeronia insecticola]
MVSEGSSAPETVSLEPYAKESSKPSAIGAFTRSPTFLAW